MTTKTDEKERAEFEAKFPMPDDCQWCGNGYAPTEFNAWEAQSYADKFKGWIARAALQSQDREDALIETALDACDEWSGYVEVDNAPRTLREHVKMSIDHARRIEEN